jgi:hypothetical protein
VSLFIRWQRGGRATIDTYLSRINAVLTDKVSLRRNILLWTIAVLVLFIAFMMQR